MTVYSAHDSLFYAVEFDYATVIELISLMLQLNIELDVSCQCGS